MKYSWLEFIYLSALVAPFVGAWIEMVVSLFLCPVEKSLRSSERGLKSEETDHRGGGVPRRSVRRSVD